MTTPNPSTTQTPIPQPQQGVHPGVEFARRHGPVRTWSQETYDRFLELHTSPVPTQARTDVR